MQASTFPYILPQDPPSIYIIGAGGIVNDAHLPAYRLAGFNVAGIYDPDLQKAASMAGRFDIPSVFSSLEEMLAAVPGDIVFDVAVPGSVLTEILPLLPEHAAILMQKPMGENLEQARKILEITRIKKQIAAVNFQLRYAPFSLAARDMIRQGLLGELCDIEVNINVFTPWHLWTFMESRPRVEILYHSIHYIDLIRTFLGNPISVFAKTVRHPNMKELASVRTNIIMDYGEFIRANILTNHCHKFGLQKQDAYIKFEGTRGAIKIRPGVLLNYPLGVPDVFEYVILEEGHDPEWKTLEIEGTWFPHAFIGSMCEVMLAKEGRIPQPDNSVEDCFYTMACVEAGYSSDAHGGMGLNDE